MAAAVAWIEIGAAGVAQWPLPPPPAGQVAWLQAVDLVTGWASAPIHFRLP